MFARVMSLQKMTDEWRALLRKLAGDEVKAREALHQQVKKWYLKRRGASMAIEIPVTLGIDIYEWSCAACGDIMGVDRSTWESSDQRDYSMACGCGDKYSLLRRKVVRLIKREKISTNE